MRREPLRLLQVEEEGRGSAERPREGAAAGARLPRRPPLARVPVGARLPQEERWHNGVRGIRQEMLSLPGHTRRDQASEEGSRAQGARSLPQPHLLHVGDGRSPAPGDSLRHDGVLDAEQVLGARSLLRRVHEADHRARPHEKTRLAGHLPRRPRAGEGGDREIQGGGRGEAGGGIGRHLRAAHRPGGASTHPRPTTRSSARAASSARARARASPRTTP